MTEQVKPLRAPGYSGDISEWDESLTTQMLVFGVLLVACFVAPWAVGGDKTVFAWSIFSIDGAPFAAKMIPILLAVTGVVSVALGALRLAPAARAFAATAVGLSPIVFQLATAKPFRWQLAVAIVGSLSLVTGLIIRSRHGNLMLGRILATVGVLAILALYLIPENDVMLVKVLLDQISDAPGKAKVLPIVGLGLGGVAFGLIPLLLTISCLLVWLPAPSRAGTPVLVWMVIFWPLVATLASLLLSEDIVASIKASLSIFLYLPLAGAAWLTLGSFGIAGVVSQRANT
tara:strand:+ start:11441 stop:12304 length:864 start_codon:yes stop_codon:yes gene_type:complete